jgi:omega-6 fatty acid desaturase (delta-12 desaturase)
VGPFYALMVQPRLAPRAMRPRLRRSVMRTNLAMAAIVGLMCWVVGWRAYLIVQLPVAFLAGAAGVWLFYVQHQFEDTYWSRGGDWSFTDAALHGSSHLALPGLLRFFTSNVGLHHIHHLNARIPSYNLQRAHDENPVFHAVPTLTLRDGVRAVRLKLWDDERGRLVTFAAARAG